MTRKIFSTTFLAALLVWTWGIAVYHLGVFIPPVHSEQINLAQQQTWIPKEKLGINQLILTGTPYERGLASGKLTQKLLYRQEAELFKTLRRVFPSDFILKPLHVLMIRWFWGGDDYFEPWIREEMDGVSQSAPHEFDFLGTGYTRQLYYHGLHEVGQMMVDQTGDDMGCTVAAYPIHQSWIIGRNFDFEGGRVFDDEKIMKWVFPTEGNAYVSIIWAGMVGAVTGVNDKGLYISLNAAGTRDFRRYGTPTTLVLLKALQYSKSVDDAIEIIRSAETFITDIFVITDRASGRMVRVEKSPHFTEIIPVTGPTIIANHLKSDRWKNDPINIFRNAELTSRARVTRGQKLITQIPNSKDAHYRDVELQILAILRDKGLSSKGERLHIGNRNGIDALITTHAAVYDGPENRLYVSQGPSLAGAFTGFDLTESFKQHQPVVVQGFDRDPLVSDALYSDLKLGSHEISEAEKLLKNKRCSEALPLLKSAQLHAPETYNYSMAEGDYQNCIGNSSAAAHYWEEALARTPAYAAETRSLKRKLSSK